MPKISKLPKKLNWKKVAIAASAVAIVAGSAVVAKQVINPGEKVVEVIDGDTFFIANRQRIRLLGVDAPEMGYCFSKESKDALVSKILNKKVILKDVKVDQYKRILALVYVDGELVNEYLAKNGFALYRWDDSSQPTALKEAGNFARNNKIGVFSDDCYQIEPPKPNCNIKGNIRDDNNVKTYLLPNCSHYPQTVVEKYKGEDWFCTEKEARAAGFTKSPECPQ